MNIEAISEQQKLRNDALYEFSDRIVTISIGLLALSVTFRNSVVGSYPDALWLIKVAWVACATSGIAGIIWRFAKVTVHHAISLELSRGAAVPSAAPHWYQRLCFWLCVVGFIVGILALTIFGFLNI
jgi:hypothetical protein